MGTCDEEMDRYVETQLAHRGEGPAPPGAASGKSPPQQSQLLGRRAVLTERHLSVGGQPRILRKVITGSGRVGWVFAANYPEGDPFAEQLARQVQESLKEN